jgi:hypothetical protein
MSTRHIVSSATLFVLAATFCSAQNIAPARSGTVQYFEGDVSIDGVKLEAQVARFSEVKEQSVLHTGLGRAEILLTPGVFLRVAENSSIKMLDNRLMSTRVEFLSGSAMLESDDPKTGVNDPAVTIIYKDFEAQAVRYAAFEITSEPGQVKVFKGEAKVTGNGTSVNVKDGNLVDLSITMAVKKFDSKTADDLYVWSRDRSSYLAAGSMSSARSFASSFGSVSSAYPGFVGGWYYNRLLGIYTFMPFGGTVYSPFGFGIYNPASIYQIYGPAYSWSGAGGARTSTTASIPLTRIVTVANTNSARPQSLPRLEYSPNLHPTLTNPARGSEPLAIRNTPPLTMGNNNAGMFGAAPVSNVGTGLSAAPVMSAPAASAPAMAAPAPAVSAPAVGVRR